MNFRIAICFLTCAQLVLASGVGHAASKVVRACVTDQPPFTIHNNGKPEGIAVEFSDEIFKRLNLTTESILIPFTRLEELSETDWAVFPSIGRTNARETKFRWVGRLAEDRFCFVIMKGTPPINSIDDARKLKTIAVSGGGVSLEILSSQGFKNLELASGNMPNAKKLIAHKVDAWFIGESVAVHAMKSLGQAESDYQCTGNFGTTSYFMATGRGIPDELFEKLQKTFSALEKEGVLKSLIVKHH